jgi:hypothetical protein
MDFREIHHENLLWVELMGIMSVAGFTEEVTLYF